MSDVFASALEGQAIANMISNLRGRLADARNDQQLEVLVIQMKEAYDARIAVLKKNNVLLQQSTNSYKSASSEYKSAAEKYKNAYERHKSAAEKNYTRALELKTLLEVKESENSSLKKDLVTALSEGLVYKALVSKANFIKIISQGLDEIKKNNGDEAYDQAKRYMQWAASQPYLSDVSAELNRFLQS